MPWARLAGIAGLFVFFAAGSALAEPSEVVGEELAALLTGNSIDGVWGETHYIQYFAASGRTLYKPDGSPGDWGTWRINEDGKYCSTWRGGGESCYLVVDIDGALNWQTEDGETTYPFDVIEGDVTSQ